MRFCLSTGHPVSQMSYRERDRARDLRNCSEVERADLLLTYDTTSACRRH